MQCAEHDRAGGSYRPLDVGFDLKATRWRPRRLSPKATGKTVQVIEAPNYHHLEMAESLGNPYGPNGRAALAMMKLAPT